MNYFIISLIFIEQFIDFCDFLFHILYIIFPETNCINFSYLFGYLSSKHLVYIMKTQWSTHFHYWMRFLQLSESFLPDKFIASTEKHFNHFEGMKTFLITDLKEETFSRRFFLFHLLYLFSKKTGLWHVNFSRLLCFH